MRTLTLLFVAAALLAPVSIASAQDSTAKQQEKKVRRLPDVISLEEIEAASDGARNAETLVRLLRPAFLRPSRGQGGSINVAIPDVMVYVNNVRRGNLQALAGVPREQIKEIRYLKGLDATQRFGIGHESGAIVITTR